MTNIKKKVLIIEDDEVLGDIYVTKLGMEGFETCLATEGFKGVEEAIRAKPDLILLDIVLPKLNGFEILKQIKGKRDTRSIPVIVLSNLGQEYEIKRGLKLGASKYLIKANYTPEQVTNVIKETFKK
jgi:DNA-binding response OmpR family regulator